MKRVATFAAAGLLAVLALLAGPMFLLSSGQAGAQPNPVAGVTGMPPTSVNATVTSGTVTVSSGTVTVTAQPSSAVFISTTFTRSATTATYTVTGVVGPAGTATLTLTPVMLPSGSSITAGSMICILGQSLTINTASVPSGMGNFRLYMYSSSPASALQDAAAFSLPSGDRTAFSSYVDLGTPVSHNGTIDVSAQQACFPVRLGAGATSFYAYLVTTNSWTPAEVSTVFTLKLRGVVL